MRGAVRGGLVLGAVAVSAAAVSAQEPVAPPGLVVEEIRSGFVVAPDLKLTSIDGGPGALAGLYGGLITDRRLLLGAGPGDAAMWGGEAVRRGMTFRGRAR